MDLSARNNNEESSHHSAASLHEVDVGLEDAFPELRSPRFVRPENDEEDYNQRSPAMVEARRQREANRRQRMKEAVAGILLDASESESLSPNEEDIEEAKQGVHAGDSNNHYKLHESAATLQTEPSISNLITGSSSRSNSNRTPWYCSRYCKIGGAVLAVVVYACAILAAGIVLGLETAPYLQDDHYNGMYDVVGETDADAPPAKGHTYTYGPGEQSPDVAPASKLDDIPHYNMHPLSPYEGLDQPNP